MRDLKTIKKIITSQLENAKSQAETEAKTEADRKTIASLMTQLINQAKQKINYLAKPPKPNLWTPRPQTDTQNQKPKPKPKENQLTAEQEKRLMLYGYFNSSPEALIRDFETKN